MNRVESRRWWTVLTRARVRGMGVASALFFCSVFAASADLKLEPLGPSTRKTGLIISEIMHRPPARDDGKQLEFIEIHNSNPFFEDVSGYLLVFGGKV